MLSTYGLWAREGGSQCLLWHEPLVFADSSVKSPQMSSPTSKGYWGSILTLIRWYPRGHYQRDVTDIDKGKWRQKIHLARSILYTCLDLYPDLGQWANVSNFALRHLSFNCNIWFSVLLFTCFQIYSVFLSVVWNMASIPILWMIVWHRVESTLALLQSFQHVFAGRELAFTHTVGFDEKKRWRTPN